MGTSRSAAELSMKLSAASVNVGRAVYPTVTQRATATKGAMVAGAASAGLRPGMRLGMDRKNPAKFGVGFNVTNTMAGKPSAIVQYRPIRIVTIFNSGAPPHVISRKGDAFGVLKFGPKSFAMGPVLHPGMKARNFWPATKAAAVRAGNRAADIEVAKALRSIFK